MIKAASNKVSYNSQPLDSEAGGEKAIRSMQALYVFITAAALAALLSTFDDFQTVSNPCISVPIGITIVFLLLTYVCKNRKNNVSLYPKQKVVKTKKKPSSRAAISRSKKPPTASSSEVPSKNPFSFDSVRILIYPKDSTSCEVITDNAEELGAWKKEFMQKQEQAFREKHKESMAHLAPYLSASSFEILFIVNPLQPNKGWLKLNSSLKIDKPIDQLLLSLGLSKGCFFEKEPPSFTPLGPLKAPKNQLG